MLRIVYLENKFNILIILVYAPVITYLRQPASTTYLNLRETTYHRTQLLLAEETTVSKNCVESVPSSLWKRFICHDSDDPEINIKVLQIRY